MPESRFSGVWASYPQVYPQTANPNPSPDDKGGMNTYPDTELMEAYDRWCEAEYDTEGHGDWYADRSLLAARCPHRVDLKGQDHAYR